MSPSILPHRFVFNPLILTPPQQQPFVASPKFSSAASIDEKIDIKHESTAKSQIRVRPKVIADSPSYRDHWLSTVDGGCVRSSILFLKVPLRFHHYWKGQGMCLKRATIQFDFQTKRLLSLDSVGMILELGGRGISMLKENAHEVFVEMPKREQEVANNMETDGSSFA